MTPALYAYQALMAVACVALVVVAVGTVRRTHALRVACAAAAQAPTDVAGLVQVHAARTNLAKYGTAARSTVYTAATLGTLVAVSAKAMQPWWATAIGWVLCTAAAAAIGVAATREANTAAVQPAA